MGTLSNRITIATLLVATMFASPSTAGAVDVRPVPTPPGAAQDAGGRFIVDDEVLGISADGARVLLRRNDRDLQVVEVATGRRFSLSASGGLVSEAHADTAHLSGDGRYVVFTNSTDGQASPSIFVNRWAVDAGVIAVVHQRPSSEGFDPPTAISHDGRIIYYRSSDENGRPLVRHDVATGQARVLTGIPALARMGFSSGGRYLLYESNGATYRYDTLTAGAELIGDGASGPISNGLAISSDGRFAAFRGHWRDLLTGGEATIEGTSWPANADVSVADDGTVAWITDTAFHPGDVTGGGLYTWNPARGHRMASLSERGTQALSVVSGVVSADGRWVAYNSTDDLLHPAIDPNTTTGFVHDLHSAGTSGIGVVDAALLKEDAYIVTDRSGLTFLRGNSALGHVGRPLLAGDEYVTSISATSTGNGYWLFTSHGRTFARGDAVHHGDLEGVALAGPIVDSVATPTDGGYYMVGEDGGVFAFGDGRFLGSVPGVLGEGAQLAQPIVAMAVTETNDGYRMVGADGGVFAFGDAEFHGSVPAVLPGVTLNRLIVGVVSRPGGYLNVAADGGIFSFGSAPFHGSLGSAPPPVDVVDVLVLGPETGHAETGYVMLDANGTAYGFGSGEELAAPA